MRHRSRSRPTRVFFPPLPNSARAAVSLVSEIRRATVLPRGEVAFCSKECRECVIEYYERKERNCSLTSIKDTPAVSGASGSDQSGASGSETVAAA
ncbi:hypothetical protein OsI_08959 [Oryza sativa Indica Group]|uniref:FLZ-type domain-containing protein n=1 Tax=Oryza sativa subsp. indica TaxID=39946 RepID=B8AIR9_ORYSI|nr:hypothetical protein OsI_08959 [Oryza sativa Indica Group]